MLFRRRRGESAAEEHQPTARSMPSLFSVLKHKKPLLVTSILITALFCTFARLIIVGRLFNHWRVGIPALCNGAVAHLDYGRLEPNITSMFSSVSNAIAMTTEMFVQPCYIRTYSFINTISELRITYVYLIVISVWQLIATIFIQGMCWFQLFTTSHKKAARKCCIYCNLAGLGFEIGSIYLGSRGKYPATMALSITIL